MSKSFGYAVALLAAVVLAAPAAYASSFVNSSVDGSVAGSRGSSDSVRLSSESSDDDRRAQIEDGTYRIARIDRTADQGQVLLTLQPGRADTAARSFQLEVPAQAFGEVQPQLGELVRAQRRSYGVQFARGEEPQAFFLVVADAWQPGIAARPLTP